LKLQSKINIDFIQDSITQDQNKQLINIRKIIIDKLSLVNLFKKSYDVIKN